jgi:hypothetical protein
MDDYDFEEEYVYEEQRDEGRFEAEYGAFARTEFERARTVEEIAAEAGVIASRRRGEVIRDPVFKFYVYVNAVFHRLVEEGYLRNVKREEVTGLLESIRNVPSPQYKNPEVFVLGYSVGKSGSIDEKQFKYLLPRLSSISANLIIKPMDLLRYANLWTNLSQMNWLA